MNKELRRERNKNFLKKFIYYANAKITTYLKKKKRQRIVFFLYNKTSKKGYRKNPIC